MSEVNYDQYGLDIFYMLYTIIWKRLIEILV